MQVKAGKCAWAAVSVWGFEDAPVSWGRAEHSSAAQVATPYNPQDGLLEQEGRETFNPTLSPHTLQGYIAHKKPQPRRTLPQAYA